MWIPTSGRSTRRTRGFRSRRFTGAKDELCRNMSGGCASRSACVLVSTEREARLARQIAPSARVHVVPNGVDTEYFEPQGEPPEGPPHVIFTGDMSYFPNEEAVIFFARQVLPLIRNEIAGVRFLIVGRNPGRKVQELQALDGVEVTGFVPDVRDVAGQSAGGGGAVHDCRRHSKQDSGSHGVRAAGGGHAASGAGAVGRCGRIGVYGRNRRRTGFPGSSTVT